MFCIKMADTDWDNSVCHLNLSLKGNCYDWHLSVISGSSFLKIKEITLVKVQSWVLYNFPLEEMV